VIQVGMTLNDNAGYSYKLAAFADSFLVVQDETGEYYIFDKDADGYFFDRDDEDYCIYIAQSLS
jgi:hypothetical protein